jgi:membrane carboxypeptidase/penicillin-binding protein PbpC
MRVSVCLASIFPFSSVNDQENCPSEWQLQPDITYAATRKLCTVSPKFVIFPETREFYAHKAVDAWLAGLKSEMLRSSKCHPDRVRV